MSAREWQLDDLMAMFPDVYRGTDRVLRCLWKTSGQGSAVRPGGRASGSARVSLSARPSPELQVRLTNDWPRWLDQTEIRALESELLRGILEGSVACEDPPWLCRLECTAVELAPVTAETRVLVRQAAAVAMQDLVKGGGWEATGGPGDHVA